MRRFIQIVVLIVVTGCSSDDLSYISIKNDTNTPIYILPYSSDFTDAEWIQPGVSDDFYSISCDCIDGFTYFSFYYDSLIVLLKDHDEDPIKFYKDGTTVNYDPKLNPFINPDVWQTQDFNKTVSGSGTNTIEKKHIFDHYFCIDTESVKSLCKEEESDPGK
jgi:hypothetical protein